MCIRDRLYTVLPECLKPRHEHFPPLDTKLRVTPSFAEAPRDGDITICYTFITHIKVYTRTSLHVLRLHILKLLAFVGTEFVSYCRNTPGVAPGCVLQYMEGVASMQDIDSWNVAGAKAVVRMACALIRDVLVQHRGYEVRENSGNFLLSFSAPEDALQFCIAAQKAFMHVRSKRLLPEAPADSSVAWNEMPLTVIL